MKFTVFKNGIVGFNRKLEQKLIYKGIELRYDPKLEKIQLINCDDGRSTAGFTFTLSAILKEHFNEIKGVYEVEQVDEGLFVTKKKVHLSGEINHKFRALKKKNYMTIYEGLLDKFSIKQCVVAKSRDGFIFFKQASDGYNVTRISIGARFVVNDSVRFNADTYYIKYDNISDVYIGSPNYEKLETVDYQDYKAKLKWYGKERSNTNKKADSNIVKLLKTFR